MITKAQMLQLFKELNDELKKQDIKGEICIVGGAAMTLQFNARISTHDIDAIFSPKMDVQISAIDVGLKHNLPVDWLNDAVKVFIPDTPTKEKNIIINLSNLIVWVPDASYILAMKVISSRPTDIRDIRFLIEHIKLKNAKDVFEIVKYYYPKGKISSRAVDMILSIFEDGDYS
jgi:hypothetical protein